MYKGQRRLQEHIKRRHNRTFPCKACDLVFNTNDELKTHRRESHKPTRKPEICPHCGKIIHSKLKRHILTHVSNICCKLCSEKFMTQEELDVHMKKHDENPNYCKRKQTLLMSCLLNKYLIKILLKCLVDKLNDIRLNCKYFVHK